MTLDPEAVEAAAKSLYEGANGGSDGPWEELVENDHHLVRIFRNEAGPAITAYIAHIEPEFNKRLIAMLRAFQASTMAFATAHKASVIEEKQALYDSSKANLYALFGLEAE